MLAPQYGRCAGNRHVLTAVQAQELIAASKCLRDARNRQSSRELFVFMTKNGFRAGSMCCVTGQQVNEQGECCALGFVGRPHRRVAAAGVLHCQHSGNKAWVWSAACLQDTWFGGQGLRHSLQCILVQPL